jgi:hypothetical protein
LTIVDDTKATKLFGRYSAVRLADLLKLETSVIFALLCRGASRAQASFSGF